MKKNIANIITAVRIICSFVLLACPTFSTAFYVVYFIAGFSDMIDGTVARKMGTVSEFGSKLDTIADFIFVVVCMIKILPVLDVATWILIWIAIIAIFKIINIASGFMSVHSVMNKITGAMLFSLPLTVGFLDLKYSASVVCAVATIAAIQERFDY